MVFPRGPSLRAAEMVSVVTAQDATGRWRVRAGMLWGLLQGRGQPSSVVPGSGGQAPLSCSGVGYSVT